MLTNAVAIREYRAEGGHEFAVLNHLIVSVTVLHVCISGRCGPIPGHNVDAVREIGVHSGA